MISDVLGVHGMLGAGEDLLGFWRSEKLTMHLQTQVYWLLLPLKIALSNLNANNMLCQSGMNILWE